MEVTTRMPWLPIGCNRTRSSKSSMGKWSDDSACPVVKCVRHRGDDVYCSVVFGTLVGVFVLYGLSL